jgi:hypothetical protein
MVPSPAIINSSARTAPAEMEFNKDEYYSLEYIKSALLWVTPLRINERIWMKTPSFL